MQKRLFLLASSLLVAAVFVAAAAAPRSVNYTINHLATHQGLSSMYVKSILQDSYGFMWIGTSNGLNRHDGHSVRRYNCFDAELQRGNNNISSLYEAADHRLWVGTDRGIYLFDPVLETFTYLDAVSDEGMAPDDWVQCIFGDGDGNVWMLVPNRGVFCLKGEQLRYYTVTPTAGDKNCIPVNIFANSAGDIFAGTTGLGIYKYDGKIDRFVRQGNNGRGFEELLGKSTLHFCERPDGTIMVMTQNGELFSFDVRLQELTPIRFSAYGDIFVRSMLCVDNEIWIGTHNGLYILNLTNGVERFLTSSPDDVTSLANNTINYLYRDRDSNVWIGTMFGGVDYYQRHGFKFEGYTHKIAPSSLSSNHIRGVACDRFGHVFVGTEDAGLNILDISTGRITRHSPGQITLTMKQFGDKVYAGYARHGMDVIGSDLRPVNMLSKMMAGIQQTGDNSSIYSFLIDNRGNKWAGGDWGLFRAEAGTDRYEMVKELDQTWVFDLFQDSRGIIWIASMGGAVWKYNPSSNTFKHYPYDEKHSNGLKSNSISSIMEASDGTIWLSSDRSGLVRYDAEADCFVSYDTDNGLPDNVVYDILEDKYGYLWFGTNSGLVKFDPRKGHVRVFTTEDGLLGNHFNYHTAAAGDDGYFYFGSLEGLVAFNPELVNDTIAPVYFTSFYLGGVEPKVGATDSPLSKAIMFTDGIDLPHDFAGMAIGVSSPSFSTKGVTHYSYRLSPTDSEWIPMANNVVTFNHLPPGKYTLEVKADNGIASTTRHLAISIRSPWYSTWWAITLLVLVVAGVAAAYLMRYRRRKERQLREKEKLYKISKEKELYENKVTFFTELAHEIRTPLSLIDAPLQAIEDEGIGDPRILRYVKVMRQNTTRLLNLTGQLLDFQKIGAEKFNITYETVDVSTTLTETLDRFEPSMVLKGKVVARDITDKSVFAVVDREAYTKILSNMFNNALKYSERNICVGFSADDTNFIVRVTSDGEKISEENRYRIFEPFFQIDSKADNNGVGIGLPLCRTLAHLMHGTIEVESNDEATNTFVLTLPLRQDGMEVELPDLADEQKAEFILAPEAGEADQKANSDLSGYSLLIVEDNEQMREFLNDQLSQEFIVETAEDGAEGLAKIKEHNFDLIITDIMMPRMDGYELCTAIKADINRSHIPVIFLTAKNDLQSKLAALKCGGEAYIEKPFSIKYFKQQVYSLLENRRHERRAFLKQPFFSVDKMQTTEADKEFMNKVIKSISANIADENFSVESMAGDFAMSRSSLLRKIKSLFNLSPVELIRTVKLKKAAELLQEGKYRIGDVCFMVGINSPSYFSKLFFKQFGISPKDFEKQCRKNSQASIAKEENLIDKASKE